MEISFLSNSKYEKKQDGNVYISINKNPIINKKIMIIGDSYREQMREYLGKIYSVVYDMHRSNYEKNFFDKYSPDIVIMEYVERYLDGIKKTELY